MWKIKEIAFFLEKSAEKFSFILRTEPAATLSRNRQFMWNHGFGAGA